MRFLSSCGIVTYVLGIFFCQASGVIENINMLDDSKPSPDTEDPSTDAKTDTHRTPEGAPVVNESESYQKNLAAFQESIKKMNLRSELSAENLNVCDEDLNLSRTKKYKNLLSERSAEKLSLYDKDPNFYRTVKYNS